MTINPDRGPVQGSGHPALTLRSLVLLVIAGGAGGAATMFPPLAAAIPTAIAVWLGLNTLVK